MTTLFGLFWALLRGFYGPLKAFLDSSSGLSEASYRKKRECPKMKDLPHKMAILGVCMRALRGHVEVTLGLSWHLKGILTRRLIIMLP